MSLYLIEVGQANRAHLYAAMRENNARNMGAAKTIAVKSQCAEIELPPVLSGYTRGSTGWGLVVESGASAREIQSLIWAAGIAWCKVRELTSDEWEAL